MTVDTPGSPALSGLVIGDDDQSADAVTDYPSVSGNGRYVAFQSMDMTLDEQAVPGKKGGNRTKAYVRDTQLGTTEMVSVVGTNTIPDGSGIKPDITPSGRYVAFASDAPSLMVGTGGVGQQVYVRDRVAKTTTPVSVSSSGAMGNGGSAMVGGPTISDNGLRVAFDSTATNLVSGDTNLVSGDTNLDTDAFVRRIGAGATERVSLDANGAEVNTSDDDDVAAVEDDTTTEEDESVDAVDALPVGTMPAISGDGTFIAYQSSGIMTVDDENGTADIYRYGLADSRAPGTTRWSRVDDPEDTLAFEATGTRTDGHTGETVPAINGTDPAITFDGRRVAFVSQGNLDGGTVEVEDGTETTATSVEPNVYLRRPNPEPDSTAPSSKASSRLRDYPSPITVTYKKLDPSFPASGVAAVRLYVKKPWESKFYLRQVDKTGSMNGKFSVKAKAKGIYRFYTVAKDGRGNMEKAPRKADTYTVRK